MSVKASFATDVIELHAIQGVPLRIKHGLGRPVNGWMVVWRESEISLTAVADQDTSQELLLIPNTSGILRIVLI